MQEERGGVITKGSYLSQHQFSRVVIFLHTDRVDWSTDDDLVCQLGCNGPVIATPWSWHDVFRMNLRLRALPGILNAFAEVEISPGRSARKLALGAGICIHRTTFVVYDVANVKG